MHLLKEYVVGMYVNKNCMVITCPSQLQSLAGDPQLAGVEDGKLYVCSSGEGGTEGM